MLDTTQHSYPLKHVLDEVVDLSLGLSQGTNFNWNKAHVAHAHIFRKPTEVELVSRKSQDLWKVIVVTELLMERTEALFEVSVDSLVWVLRDVRCVEGEALDLQVL